MINPKDSIGSTKPPMSTVPANVLLEVGAAMLEGALKYGRHNWRVAGIHSSIYYDACLRHLMAWWEGEDLDTDSGVSHITKAIAGLIVLRDAQLSGLINDDRPPSRYMEKDWMRSIEDKVTKILIHHKNHIKPFTEDNHGDEEETTIS